MNKWNSIQLNGKYTHICEKCNELRKETDYYFDEMISVYGMDTYVHYAIDGDTLCGNKDMCE